MSALQSARRCGGELLPFEPLEALLATGCGVLTAQLLGVNRRQVYRWRETGVSWAQADELAIRAGLHPSSVWGRSWWDGIDGIDGDDL